MKRNKLLGSKGVTVWDMSKIAMTLVFVGVTLAIGVWVNLELATTSFPTVTMNQSFASWGNNTWNTLAFKAQSISSVGNLTHIVPLDSETLDGSGAYWKSRDYGYETQVIHYINATTPYDSSEASTFNVTFSAYNSSAHFIVMNATKGTSTLAQWLPIMMVVFAAAIIIAALMMWFGKR